MDGEIRTKAFHPGNKPSSWIWQPLPSKLNRICKAKGETQNQVIENRDIFPRLIFMAF